MRIKDRKKGERPGECTMRKALFFFFWGGGVERVGGGRVGGGGGEVEAKRTRDLDPNSRHI